MCKRRVADMRVNETQAGYEGQTIRLKDNHGSLVYHQRARHHFPWWALWLIWPMIGLVKWLVPLMVGVVGTVAEIVLPIIPVALILVGVWLLFRK